MIKKAEETISYNYFTFKKTIKGENNFHAKKTNYNMDKEQEKKTI